MARAVSHTAAALHLRREKFRALAEFKEKNGHLRLPSSKEKLSLASWASSQRTAYKRRAEGKASSLTPARIEKLEGLGFRWKLAEARPWEELFQRLREFKDAHGHCNVPQSEVELSGWARVQRRARKRLQEGVRPLVGREDVSANAPAGENIRVCCLPCCGG